MYLKEVLKVSQSYMKKCPLSVTIKQMQIKTTMKYHGIGNGRIKLLLTLYRPGRRHSQTGRTQGQDIPLNKFPRFWGRCRDMRQRQWVYMLKLLRPLWNLRRLSPRCKVVSTTGSIGILSSPSPALGCRSMAIWPIDTDSSCQRSRSK